MPYKRYHRRRRHRHRHCHHHILIIVVTIYSILADSVVLLEAIAHSYISLTYIISQRRSQASKNKCCC